MVSSVWSLFVHGQGACHGQAEVLAWLNCGGTLNDSLQRLMVRLYASEGVPDTKKLKQYEQKLSELFFANSVTGPESNDEDEQHYLIKSAALFLSTRKPRYFLSFENVERFYQQVATGNAGYKLEQLITLLHSYGGAGVIQLPGAEQQRQECFTEAPAHHVYHCHWQ